MEGTLQRRVSTHLLGSVYTELTKNRYRFLMDSCRIQFNVHIEEGQRSKEMKSLSRSLLFSVN